MVATRNNRGPAKRRSLKAVAGKVVRQPAPVATPRPTLTGPSGRVELDTPARGAVSAVINLFRSPNSLRVRPGSWPTILERVNRKWKASMVTLKRIAKQAKNMMKKDPLEVDLSRNWRGSCGASTKLTESIALEIFRLQGKHFGRLSYRKLTGKLQGGGVDVKSHKTVMRWCKALGVRRIRRVIKPLLTLRHKIARLVHAFDELQKDGDDNPAIF